MAAALDVPVLGLPRLVDTVIVGNGPSALLLSYILHGHIPHYKGQHFDPVIHGVAASLDDLLEAPEQLAPGSDLLNHLRSSSAYPQGELPVNALIDTLIRPKGDWDADYESCVEWRYEPRRAVKHLVLGEAASPGGQWAQRDSFGTTKWDVEALSNAEQLQLPGYTFAEHFAKQDRELPDPDGRCRLSRRDVADYYAAYPEAVGIADCVHTSIKAHCITRQGGLFSIGVVGVLCRHLVLASGVWSINVGLSTELSKVAEMLRAQESQQSCSADASEGSLRKRMRVLSDLTNVVDSSDTKMVPIPRTASNVLSNGLPDAASTMEPLKRSASIALSEGVPFAALPVRRPSAARRRATSIAAEPEEAALLVIGSGFTAADVINTAPPGRSIVHIFNWGDRENTLKTCDNDEYPEYARLYRLMKLEYDCSQHTPMTPSYYKRCKVRENAKGASAGPSRDWSVTYEGFANAKVLGEQCSVPGHIHDSDETKVNGKAVRIRISTASGLIVERVIGAIEFAGGRRGSVGYLSASLRRELFMQAIGKPFPDGGDATTIDRYTLRAQARRDLQIMPFAFIVGSLTGDTLVRFALGSCFNAAHKIMNRPPPPTGIHDLRDGISLCLRCMQERAEYETKVWRRSGCWTGAALPHPLGESPCVSLSA
ncbi:hypothetical protein B0A49_08727 [Cryomyces minteri]|uniref:Uncharacterized protein n=1 Tax=Cryomyces minteri TaxID=331657 RepID=A0A4U0WXA6_9PEZI|nr:hypothetical protein B0A49_08727 [Cryomyces minteri]